MKINQVEELVGITKKNIRFYEEQGLIKPMRNIQNGYREYTQQDVDTLLKIKLLRKLSIPIEEIRNLQENRFSLYDCLERHEIYLKHQERVLELTKEMCRMIIQNGDRMNDINAGMYLDKMKEIEKGGVKFTADLKRDTKKRKAGPIIAAAVIVLVFLAYVLWIISAEDIPVFALIIFIAVPTVIIVGVILALSQRLKEIEEGEEDEASKY